MNAVLTTERTEKTIPDLLAGNSFVLTNAMVVTETECFSGSLEVKNGLIANIDSGNVSLPGAIDCESAWLMPGLVELHTDNLEKYFAPRPGVIWPASSAVVTHDAQIAASGITTVFDAISVGDIMAGSTRLEYLSIMIKALAEARKQGTQRAEHFLHLRCEVSHPEALEMFSSLVDEDALRLVSIMDHSPGQRQFVNIDKYREYYGGKHGIKGADMEKFISERIEWSRRFSDRYRKAIAEICHERSIPLASHDDATVEHVAESAYYGMSIAEFPTTLEAAQASNDLGLKVMMGAPNIVRGGSHSGNIAAAALADEGLLDILSSDYYPSSLLDGVFMLARMESNAYDLCRAIATVTAAPAASAGLVDRGTISIGKRADLLLVTERQSQPLIRSVWTRGTRVF
ncbi:alpha-D-ribose 1-methylphosphonate 5-triphosphate diphosphatase [Allohahella marinimesophila]|uniref:Alpha-D-ribose 1-methylphosphonate 5-triphosphate diphosphatase n=1 Tax=Allohahella marinimesophila TaxID=1054972 RepID=A0ABP7PMI2_9GAMM